MAMTSYIRQRPLQIAWVGLNILLGAGAGAFLFWGPFTLNGLWPVLGGLLGGMAAGLPWYEHLRSLEQGEVEKARQIRKRLFWIQGMILVGVGATMLAQYHLFGALKPLTQNRQASFNRLWWAMEKAYPYFEEKGVDWRVVKEKYAPLIARASTDDEYFQTIGAALGELHDGHTRLLSPYYGPECCFAFTREIEGQAVIIQSGSEAEAVGLLPGSILQSVNGQPVLQALAAPAVQGYSTPWNERVIAFFYLLAFPREGGLAVTFIDPQGEQKTVTLERKTGDSRSASQSAPGIVSWERLDSGVGYIRIRQFWNREGSDLVTEFDDALNSLADAPGIILDIRGNGGGDSTLADKIAGRFYASKFVYGEEVHPARLPFFAWRGRFTYDVSPRGTQYAGPVALLVDERVISSAEMFVASLADSGRVQTFGRQTAGASGNPITFHLPGGGFARFSTGSFSRNNGMLVEGVGIAPDYPVAWSLEDVRLGRDADISAADAWLQEQFK